MDCTRRSRLGGFLLLVSALGSSVVAARTTSERLQVVPFGTVLGRGDSGTTYTVVWDDPRDLGEVLLEFAEGTAPPRGSIRIEYWLSSWPEEHRPRDRRSGAGLTGWINLGDPHQGRWQVADTNERIEGNRRVFTFNPANAIEFPWMARDEDLVVGDTFGVQYRTTYKVRCRSDRPLPEIVEFLAYTDSTVRPMDIEIVWEGDGNGTEIPEGTLEIHNGLLDEVGAPGDPDEEPARSVSTQRPLPHGRNGPIQVSLRYAVPEALDSYDRTVITLRTARGSMSFAPDDLLRWGHVFAPDLGVLIRESGDTTTFRKALDRWKNLSGSAADIYNRIRELPEQTLESAWRNVPAKKPHEIPLGFEGGRQRFKLDEHGKVTADKGWIVHLPGKDTERCLWSGYRIEYDFGLPRHSRDGGGVLDGFLPMMINRWNDGGRRYTQKAFAAPLEGQNLHGRAMSADETVVLFVRIEIDGDALASPADTILRIRSRTERETEHLVLRGDGIHARDPDGMEHLRMLIRSGSLGGIPRASEEDGAIAIHGKPGVQGGVSTVDILIPFVTLTEEGEIDRLGELDFDTAWEQVREYWRGRIERGIRLYTPEKKLNDFYRGFVPHALINLESHIDNPEWRVARVGSILYGVYGNESSMMIAELDRRGYHDLAERALRTWVEFQGTVGLPGMYRSSDGVLHGAGGYEDGGYNQDHGWILWAIAEHYRITRDRNWLLATVPAMLRAVDWIRRERASREERPAIEKGLLPPGRLEDVRDWKVWLATNVYSWLGLERTAWVLGEIGHPSAGEAMAEADSYRQDIIRAFGEASLRSPRVRLRDGSWIPHFPAEVHRRGRSFGWLRETLQGAVHMVCSGLLEPHDERSTWILRDYEDNLFLSERFGYRMTEDELRDLWFHRGGISMQANLLCTPTAYLLRDEPEHFLRALFNAFAASYFPDTGMMVEHALPEVGDWAGDHYKTSDEANVSYWLRSMFLWEDGPDLRIGTALPREWFGGDSSFGIERAPTYFGTTSVRYSPRPADGTIEARIEPPRRNPPERMLVRFRHPEKKPIRRCEVNGRECPRIDPEKEWVELEPSAETLRIVVFYDSDSPGIW